LLLRRILPGPMAAGLAAVAGGYLLLGYPWGPFGLSLVLGLVFAVLARARWWAWGAVAGLAVLLGAAVAAAGTDADLARLGAGLAWLTVVVLVAELLRTRSERLAERRRALLKEQQRARDEERLMLARDIHDVVAHSLSLINVQASVALHLADKDPGQLKPALETIKSASRDALAEVREVLDVLRQDAPRSPVQRLGQLPELLSQAARTGLQVSLSRPLPAGLDARLETAAYRMVQEALTNTVRHARASRAWVEIYTDGAELVIRVADDGVGPGAAGTGLREGNGLRGMRERVEALGGRVAVRDRSDV
ncbi:sensor histidine kinase, partial [Arthrobacter sp. GCM10027362]|uniref:sensor histidine kinase n=1 Tax=Arthrobacter sp. GCM10027362 TaxID=3273379 RepID=UPI003636422B